MNINIKDYPVLKYMITGQSFKVPHQGCSDSKALSITMDVEGYLFHCFKCGESYFIPHDSTTFRDRKLREAEKAAFLKEKERAGFDFPADFSHTIEDAGLAWLGSGGWTYDMLFKYKAGWSSRLSRVVFGVQPIGYTARAVHDDQVPKYLSKLPREAYWWSEPITDRVCVVEDILSAGKVGQLYPSMALLGTDWFNKDILTRCKTVLIWTDSDKAGQKCRQDIRSFLQWMPEIKVYDIETKLDPKRYSLKAIGGYLERNAYVRSTQSNTPAFEEEGKL